MGLSIEQIAEATELSVQEITRLRKQLAKEKEM
jgi:predicted transposase YdaD